MDIKGFCWRLLGGATTEWRPTGELRTNRRRRRVEQRWTREMTNARVSRAAAPKIDEQWRPQGATPDARRVWYARAVASDEAVRSAQGPDSAAYAPPAGDDGAGPLSDGWRERVPPWRAPFCGTKILKE